MGAKDSLLEFNADDDTFNPGVFDSRLCPAVLVDDVGQEREFPCILPSF